MRQLGKGVLLVDDLRKLAATEEKVDAAGDTLGVHQLGDFRNFLGVFQAHPLLHGSAEFQETPANFVRSQLVDSSQPTVAKVVDIIDMAFTAPQVQHVSHGVDKIFRANDHLVFRDILAELSIDAEPTDSTEAITVLVVELLGKQRLGLLQLGGVARTKPGVNPQYRALVIGRWILSDGVENQRVRSVGDDFDFLLGRCDDLVYRVADLSACWDEFLAGFRVDITLDEVHLRAELLGGDFVGLVKLADNLRRRAEFFAHRPQEHGRGDFAGLVDPHCDRVFLGNRQFDPAAALGDNSRPVQRAVGLLHFHGKIDARAAVQLRYDNSLGTVDDELTAACHYRNFADVDALFQNRLDVFAFEAAADTERQPVGQTQVATFLRLVSRLAKLVVDVLQAHRFVVADDGEHFSQQSFQTFVFPLTGQGMLLNEPSVTGGLKLYQIRYRSRIADLIEISDLVHF